MTGVQSSNGIFWATSFCYEGLTLTLVCPTLWGVQRLILAPFPDLNFCLSPWPWESHNSTLSNHAQTMFTASVLGTVRDSTPVPLRPLFQHRLSHAEVTFSEFPPYWSCCLMRLFDCQHWSCHTTHFLQGVHGCLHITVWILNSPKVHIAKTSS